LNGSNIFTVLFKYMSNIFNDIQTLNLK